MDQMTGRPSGGLMPRGLAPAAGKPQSDPDMGGDPGQASPEEQAQYDRLVANAFISMYSENSFPAIVKSLEGGGDPVQGLADTAVRVFSHVLASSKQNGFEASPDVLWSAGTEVLEDLAHVATNENIHDFSQDRDGLEAAFFRAADAMRVSLQKSGGLDQEAARKDMAMLQEMDRSGELEKKMMGLAERDAGGGRQAAQPPQQQAAQQPTRRGLMPERMM